MNKTGSKILHGMLLATSAMVASTVIVSTAAMANPAGGSVAAGSATITNPSATQTVINQSSKRALINWNSFNVGSGSSVQFNQPNAKSLTVNRVTGPGSSAINGSIFANGNIWLLNANGILFGKGSQINVGSLLATTSELSDADFKAGNNNFTASPNPNASVVNQGTISASRGGSVVLSAPRVSNEGMIEADLGTVVLGGAQAFTVDMTGDNLLRYEISAPVTQTPADAQGKPALALVSNSGTIAAAGGHVVMTARAAQNVQDNVINNTGMVEATSVSVHGGEVDIDAGPDGTANVGGTVDASGAASGQTGGTVTVTGGTANVADGAKINVSGNAGGGTVLIGGGPHGTGTLAHAQRTVIGAATINADATGNGNGGNVTVWSDGTTQFNGAISSRGGAQGGNGGQVETSGHNLGVAASAKVDTSAPLGLTGDWLLDPVNIDIVSGSDDSDDPLNTGTSCATITNGTIDAALVGSNVTLEATSNINLTRNADLSWSSANTLSLLSRGNISILSSIQGSGTGGLNIIAGWDGHSGVDGSQNVDVSAITAHGVYGNSSGSISINPACSSVSIGSALGQTTLAGADITIHPSNGMSVQIGYAGAGGSNIDLLGSNGIEISASDASGNQNVMIGNGIVGGSLSGSVTGDISIMTGGVVNVTAGSNGTVLIGDGNIGGTISGDVTGDIVISANGALNFNSGNITLGDNSGTTTSGDVTIVAQSYSGSNSALANNLLADVVHGDVFAGFTSGGTPFTVNATAGNDYASSHNLTLATRSGLFIVSSLQNSDSGDITLIGGWDGNTTSPSMLTPAYLLAHPSEYGNGGEVTIGTLQAAGTVLVGSAGGTTTVAGQNVVVDASNGVAQIGWQGDGGGDIDVLSNGGNITVSANTDGLALYAQIGNTGATTMQTGDITVVASGNVTVTGGANQHATALIGHGGFNADASFSGDISVTAGTGDITLIAGDAGAAIIGHDDGFGSLDATSSSKISVIATAGNISLSGSTNAGEQYGFAQIGTAGTSVKSGNITVQSGKSIALKGGASNGADHNSGEGLAWAQIGSTGDGLTNVDINVTVGGNLTLTGGTGAAFGGNNHAGDGAQIGNGGVINRVFGGDGDINGNVAVNVTGATNVKSSIASNDAWIGNIPTSGHASTGTTTLTTATLSTSSDQLGSFARALDSDLVNGNVSIELTNQTSTGFGALNYNSGHNLTIASTGDLTLSDAIDNSGNGAVSLTAGGTNFGGNAGTLTIDAGITTAGSGYTDAFLAGDSININGNINVGSDRIFMHAGESRDDGNAGAILDTSGKLLTADTISIQNDKGGTVDQTVGTVDAPIDVATNHLSVITATGDIYINSPNGGFDIGDGFNGIIGANVALSAAGDITQTSADAAGLGISASDLTVTSITGNIDLSETTEDGNGTDNAVRGSISLQALNGIMFDNRGDTTIAAIDGIDGDAAGAVTLEAFNGGVSQTGAVHADSLNVRTEDAAHDACVSQPITAYDISLTNATNNITGTFAATAHGDVSFTNTGAITLGDVNAGPNGSGVDRAGNISITSSAGGINDTGAVVGSSVTLMAHGDITQTGGLDGGNFSATSTTGEIALLSENDFDGPINLSAANGSAAFNNNDNTTLGTVAVLGNVTVLSTGNLTVTSSIDQAGAGNVTLVAGWDGTQDSGAYGEGGATYGDIFIGSGASAGLVSVGSQSGATTIEGHDINVNAPNGSQIGHHGAGGGNITILGTGNVTIAGGSGHPAQIGNGGLTGTITGNITGDIVINTTGVITANSVANATWLGNAAETGSFESGNLTVVANGGSFSGPDLVADLGTSASTGGNVFIGLTDDDSWVGGLTYSSPHAFTWASEGTLEIIGDIQNSGTGAMNLIGGWDGTTTDLASLGNSSVYGQDGGDVVIGANSGTTNVHVGGGGLVTVEGANVTLDTTHGVAQLGYASNTGGGNIVVLANGTLTLAGGASAANEAQIGNGASFGGKSATGNITITAHSVSVSGNATMVAGNDATITTGERGIGSSGQSLNVALNSIAVPHAGSNDGSGANVYIAAAGSIVIGNGVNGIQTNGDLVLTATGDITQTSSVLAGFANISTTSGNITLTGGGNYINSVYLAAPGNAALYDGADLEINGGAIGGNATFLTTGNLTADGSLQNTGSGNIMLVAGWDGSTSPTGIAANASSYGRNNGSVLFGGENASGDVYIGSQLGTTSVYGYDVNVVGTPNGLAQLGYNAGGSGAIIVNARDDISVTATIDCWECGGSNSAFIGNGSWGVASAVGGSITLVAGHDVLVSGEGADAGIGNEGAASVSGTINVNATHDISLSGLDSCEGACGNTGYIGNNGGSGVVSGNISLTAGHDVLLSGEGGFASIGNFGAGTSVGGAINITATGNVSLGGGENGHVQIGNAGEGTTISGTVNVTAAGNISVGDGYAGTYEIGNSGIGEGVVVGGDVSVTANGTSGITTGGEGFGQIGNSARGDDSSVGGNITVTANGGGIDFSTSSFGDATVMIGNYGIGGTDPTVSGNIIVSANGGDVDLRAYSENDTARIGNSGAPNGTIGGDIAVHSSGDINIFAGDDDALAQIGNGASDHDGDISGNINVTAVGSIDLTATGCGSASRAAMIGNGDPSGGSSGNVTGDISIHATNDISFDAVVGTTWLGNIAGTGDVESGNVTVLANTVSDSDDASFGHMIVADLGSSNVSGGNVFVGLTSNTGNIGGLAYDSPHTLSIATTGNLNITDSIQNAGAGALNLIGGWDGTTFTPASLGNSGVYGNNSGSVNIGGSGVAAVGSAQGVTTVAGYNVTLSGAHAGAQIGYDGASSESGNISVVAKHDVILTAGNCTDCYVKIGDGGGPNATLDGGANITVAATGNITLTGGAQSFAYAQIGNGGDSTSGSYGGNIAIAAGGTLTVLGSNDYAQIGNGGLGANGSAGGNIVVNVYGDVNLTGASINKDGYAQIGNGGRSANGADSGNITVTSNHTIALTAGNNGRYAQIGNGGAQSGRGSSSGDIIVNAAALSLTGAPNASTQDDFVEIGNNSNNGNASGAITINVTGTASVITTKNGGDVAIGNDAVSNGTSSGTVNITTGDFADDLDLNDAAVQFVSDDLAGGAVTFGITDASSNLTMGGINYSSANAFTFLTAGNLIVNESIQNGGTGNITLVTGWNPAVTPTAVATTTGAYGNHNATLTIGGAAADGGTSVGSAGGTTRVLTDNLTVDAVQGTAQLGYAGAGNGAIVVSALGNVLIDTHAVADSQIGNGGWNITGPVGGSVTINAGGNITVNSHTGSSIPAIGNMGRAGASVGGDIALTAANTVDIEGANANVGNTLVNGTNIAGSMNGAVNITAAALTTLSVSPEVVTGNSANIVLTGAGNDIGGSGSHEQLGVAVNSLALRTNNGSAYIASPTKGLSVGVGGNGINLGTGNLSVTAGGAITQTVAINADLVSISTNGGDIVLTNAGNAITDASLSSSGDAALTDSTGLTIASAAVTGNLTLTATSIAQTGAVNAKSLTASASNGDIVLNNAGNAITDASLTSSGDASLTDAGNLTIAGASAGNLTLNSTGSIGQTGAISANSLAVTASNVALTNASNTIAKAALTSSGDAALTDSTGLTIAGAAVTGNLTLTATSIAQTGAISAKSLTASASNGDIVLNNAGNAITDASLTSSGDAALTDSTGLTIAGAAVTGNLTLAATSIAQTGAISAKSLTASASNGDIVLNNAGNTITDASLTSSGDASLTDAGNLTIAGASAGNLTLNSTGSIGQTGAISANSLAVTASNVALTNASNTIAKAAITSSGDAALTDSTGLTIAGAAVTGNLTLAATSIAQTGAISAKSLTASASNGDITLTNAGNAIADASLTASGNASLTDASSLTITGATVGNALTLNSTGSIGQTGAISANSLAVTASNVALTNASNTIAKAALTSSGDAALTDSTGLTIAGAAVTGNLTLTATSIAQTGAISAKSLTASASNGDITLTNAGNAIADASLTASGNASLYEAASLTLDQASVGGDLALLTKGDLIFASSVQLTGGSILGVAGWDGTTAGAAAAAGSAYGNNGHDITVDGGVAVGSRTGSTTLATNDLLLSAINNYAQVGYHGGGSGAILVNATGNVTLNGGSGAAYFAQIGDGGYNVSGSNSGAVSVLANGNVALNAGGGQEAYAQIGNGGAESNSNSSGYTNTGAITVHGKTVALSAGSGSASYAQIGDGGYKSGQGLNGTATVGSDIEIDAVSSVALKGNAADAYAQIGNGGDFVNAGGANGSGGTTSGNILVAVSSPAVAGNAVAATAGSGANAYAQIGNGGNSENVPGSGNTVTFTVSGNITVNDLALTGSNTGANGYAQIGNGDGAGSGTGNIGGNINISQGTQFFLTPGTAPGTSTGIQNKTGAGTVSGSVTGYTGTTPPPPPPPPAPASDPTTAGSVSSIIQNTSTPTSFTIADLVITPQLTSQAGNFGTSSPSEQTPLDKLAGNDEEDVPSDGVAHSVGGSLEGGKTHTATKTIIPGVLQEIVTLTPRNPHGIPPADQDYSSWGNEAFWRW